MHTTGPKYDVIQSRGHSLYQHGRSNDRVYLMKLAPEDCPSLIDDLEALARRKGYGKIFAKAPAFSCKAFQDRGFVQEARVPAFYNGRDDAFFWGKFLDPARAIDPRLDTVNEVLAAANAKRDDQTETPLAPPFHWQLATDADADPMTRVYKTVFETYPFPIHDPEYLRKTMRKNIVYFLAFEESRLVAIASSEMDEPGGNVEMTDFATLPECRGHGIAAFLLRQMERAMRERGIQTAYTIARALSFGMNIAFAKSGYEFAGTLINNTNICGALESMNVWHKPL
jgi:putative beta-lysine N-acetyltransferase